ncbi:hypothetical protein [Aliagarivorans marinus]|uniref:hypothetical protein n=1 Tax=Aliagarivorans marinus TaxID=561965 RepID=UPI00146FA088
MLDNIKAHLEKDTVDQAELDGLLQEHQLVLEQFFGNSEELRDDQKQTLREHADALKSFSHHCESQKESLAKQLGTIQRGRKISAFYNQNSK